MSCRTTYLPSLRELPSLTTRPSCAATTVAFAALCRSTSCRACPLAPPGPAAAPAAAVGEGGAVAPGSAGMAGAPAALADASAPLAEAPLGTAVAWPVALDTVVRGAIELQATRPSRTGSRPSVSPVRVAMTAFGYVEISFARNSTELTY